MICYTYMRVHMRETESALRECPAHHEIDAPLNV